MGSIDERVVELKFNNGDFANKVDRTIAQAKKLETSLSFGNASTGLENVSRSIRGIKLGVLSSAADTVTARFGAMQVAAMTAVQSITNTLLGSVKKVVTAIPNQIWSGGWSRAMNLEKAKFQIEGLGASWEDLYKDISYAVDGTAYGLDAAAVVASQLTASGIESGEQMKYALRGVSGVAAMTSSSYADIGRIYTQVAGQGRLMGDQLLQLSGRGINAAATLAKYLGKTEAEVREMVSAGEIDFDTFAKAMDDAFGEHAKKANETFEGALSNVKSALSRIGAEIATPLIQNMIPVFNALREMINGIKGSLGPVFDNISSFIESASKKAVSLIEVVTGQIGKTPAINLDMWNKAGTDLDQFKDILIDVAREHDIAIDEMIETEGSFEDTLANGWLTKGIFDEAYDSLIKTEGASQELRDAVFELGKSFEAAENLSTFQLFIASFENVLGGAKTLMANFKEAFNKAFSISFGVENVRTLAEKLYEFTSNVKISSGSLAVFRESLQGFFAAVSIVIKGVSAFASIVGTAFSALWSIISPIGSLIGDILREIASCFMDIDEALSSSEWLAGTISGLKDALTSFGNDGGAAVQALVDKIRSAKMIQEFFQNLRSAVSSVVPYVQLFVNHLSTLGYALSDIFGAIGSKALSMIDGLLFGFADSSSVMSKVGEGASIFSKGLSVIKDAVSSLLSVLGKFVDVVKQLASGLNPFENLVEETSAGLEKLSEPISKGTGLFGRFNGVIGIVRERLQGLGEAFSNLASSGMNKLLSFMGSIISSFSTVSSTVPPLEQLFGIIQKFPQMLSDLAPFIRAVGDAIMKIMVGVSFNSMSKSFGELTKSLGGFMGILNNMTPGAVVSNLQGLFKTVKEGIGDLNEETNTTKLLKIAGAIALLALSLIMLAGVDIGSLAKALGAIAIGITEMVVAMSVMEKIFSGATNLKALTEVSIAMIALASAMVLMAVAVRILENVDITAIGKLGLMLALVVGAMYGLSKVEKGVMRAAVSMQMLAVALILLTIPILILGSISIEKLVQGLLGIAAALGVMVGALAIMSKIGNVGRVAASLSLLAGALILLLVPLLVLGNISLNTLAQGLGGVGVSLGVMIGALAVMSKIKGGTKAAVTLIVMAEAILLLSAAVAAIGSMSTESLVQGLVGIAGAFVVLIGSLAIMKRFNLKASIAELLGIVGSLMVIVEVIEKLGAMKTEDLAKGLIGLGLALVVVLAPLGIFMAVFSKMPASVQVQLLGLSVALLAMSVAVLAVAAALSMLAGLSLGQILVGIVGLAAGLAVVIGAMYLAGSLAAVLAPGVLIFLAFGAAIALVGAGLLMFASGLAALTGVVGTIGVLLAEVVSAINSQTDAIAAMIANMIRSLIDQFGNSAGEMGKNMSEGISQGLIGILDGIRDKAPSIIDSFTEFVSTLADTIAPKIPIFVEKGVAIVTALMQGLGEQAPTLAQSGMDLIIDLINALADTLENSGEELRGACDHLVQSIIDFIIEFITGKNQEVDEQGKTIGQGIVDGIQAGIDEFGANVLGKIGDFVTSIIDKAKGLLGIASPSTVFESIGGDMMSGLENGIDSNTSGPLNVIGSFIESIVGKFKPDMLVKPATGLINGALDKFGMFKDSASTAFNNGLSAVQTCVGSFVAPLTSSAGNIVSGMNSSFLSSSGILVGTATGMMGSVTSAVESSSHRLPAIATTGISGYTASIRAGMFASIAASKAISTGVTSALQSGVSSAKSAGTSLVNGFTSAIRSGSGGARGAASSVASNAAGGFSGYSAWWAGYNLSSGFASGIRSGSYLASAAASAVASAALSAIKSKAREASPSKVTRQYGKWFTEGWIIGIMSLKDESAEAAEEIGKNAVDTIGAFAKALSNGVDMSLDYNPTITPIVDLDNVKAAGGYIDQIMSNSYGFGLGSTLGRYPMYGDASSSTNMVTNNVSVTLQYQAGSDANMMAEDLASALTSKLNLEG